MARKKITGSAREHQQILLREFQKLQPLCIRDMQHILQDCSRANAYNNFNALKKMGYTFEDYTQNKVKYYTLISTPDTSGDLELLTPKIFQKYLILHALQSSSYINQKHTTDKILMDTLKRELNIVAQEERCEDLQLTSLNLSHTRFHELFQELVNSGIISQPAPNTPYMINQPFETLKKYQRHVLEEECKALSVITKATPYYNTLRHVYKKQCITLEKISSDEISRDKVLIYGKNYECSESNSVYLKKLFANKCETNYIKIKYQRPKDSSIQSYYFATELILYSAEKDQLYLIGKTKRPGQTHANQEIVLKCNQILDVLPCDETHELFENPEHLEFLPYIFSLASYTKKKIPVTVVFENTPDIQTILSNLHEQRIQTSRLEELADGSLKYTDKIADIENFAKFLRRFGAKARIMDSPELIAATKHTIANTLHQYKEAENEFL